MDKQALTEKGGYVLPVRNQKISLSMPTDDNKADFLKVFGRVI